MKREFAIVAEGGGQRGIFTAGILDSFLSQQFNPFDLGCGVSAGAQNLLAYFLEQPGYARRAIAELTARPDFLVPYRWLSARNIIDLDGYFDATLRDPDYRLPYQQLGRVQCQRRLQMVATDRQTLETVYLEPDESTVLQYMKASSAVPFLYRSGVPFGNLILVDGGVSDPLPVRHVYAQGFRKILLIRTVPMPEASEPAAMDPDDQSLWRQRLLQVRRLSSVKLPGRIIEMLACHEAALKRSLEFIHSPPDDLELVTVAPHSPLQSQVFGSRSDALLNDYQSAVEQGMSIIDTLARWQQSRVHSVSSTEYG